MIAATGSPGSAPSREDFQARSAVRFPLPRKHFSYSGRHIAALPQLFNCPRPD
ncbi:hypothetical protein THTE_3280 [Thermogutta terrifontis]|uniref:Uncharacterized protein n=1 Tax=Thermogutta terrifontis TaxID=1331910 RepID=A0A286RIZ3_9BACT|nr:hypothetical protein THTE_3280 [Thermogutta terrifontis]